MSADDNIKAIMNVYDAFGRGDVAGDPRCVDRRRRLGRGHVVDRRAVVRRASTARRASPSSSSSSVRRWRSRSSVPCRSRRTRPTCILSSRHTAKSRATGKTATMNLHHYFKFVDGKIAYYRGSEDTALTAQILQP